MKNLLSLLFFLFTMLCYGQSGKLFTVDRELSNSSINSIYQDSKGVIWIATDDGLNRYDGAKFSVYKHDIDNVNSLIDNNVRVIFEDSKGHLIIGTLRGLQLYDFATDLFREIPINYESGESMNAHITAILERKNGELLIATSGHGVFSVNLNGKKSIISTEYLETPCSFIKNIFEDRDENLWISTERKGLFCINKSSGDMRQYFSEKESAWNVITAICQDEQGVIYAGSIDKGVFVYDNQRDTFSPIPHVKNSKLPVTTLYPIDKGRIYIGTAGYGIQVYDTHTKEIKEEEFNLTTFRFNKSEVQTIMKDCKNGLWLGIKSKGLLLLPTVRNQFKYIGYRSLATNKIGSNSIVSIYKDHNGILWLGTENDGIYEVGDNDIPVRHFEHSENTSSVPSNIVGIYEDSNNKLWLASPLDGLAQMNRKTGECKYYNLIDNRQNNIKRVFCFAEDSLKRLWVGTMGGGLFYINLEDKNATTCKPLDSGRDSNEVHNVVNNNWIASLLYTRNNKLYIGTYDGLGCLDLEKMSFASTYKRNRLFPGNVIYTLYEDHQGDIWIGTSKGLIRLNEATEEYETYTTKDGLPNDVICAIQGDDNNHLWISTNYGISHFNPEDKSFTNYYAGDGLQGNEFSKNTSFVDEGGNIIFGGINGVTYFNPREITTSIDKPEIRISDFYIYDRAVKKGMMSGKREVIYTSVPEAKEFNLCHKDNSFSIEFSAMEFYNPERITYEYSMNNGQWVNLAAGVNRISFSNLAPGNYSFRVKAKDYATYSDTKEILITIYPPWYASGWAKLVYVLLVLTIIYFIIIQIRHRYRVHQEIQKHIHAEQINEAKLQFFINISHEIRTPMSLIISPLQQLITTDKDAARQKTYFTIYRNAERILQLVNQLMDIRKIDKGQMSLLFRKTEIVSFIEDLCDALSQKAKNKHIELEFHHDVEALDMWVDPVNFDKIILNILSNAFKFTPQHGKVDVCLSTGEDSEATGALQKYAEIIISDNGIGIDENGMEHIFERFYQICNSLNNSNVGTGIGLHLTRSLVELHHGTIKAENNKKQAGCRFIIRLPLGKEHLRTEEIKDNAVELDNQVYYQRPILVEEAAVDEEKSKSKTKSKHYVLVVEDDEEIRRYICNELSNEFNVVESPNGKEALAMILKKAPDLVISDVMMPEMDGLTLCRKIKQNITINHVPVILLTAKSSDEDNLEGLSTGADAYIVKPFNIEILRKKVSNIIKSRKQLRNTFSGQQDQVSKVQDIEIQSPDDKLMGRIMKVINANISNPNLTVEMITTEVGISRVHLHRKLKELTNQTTRDFIRNVRLKQAASLLAEKRHSITEVAALTGFTHITYFSTVFKEMYGVSPTVYMEQHLNAKKESGEA